MTTHVKIILSEKSDVLTVPNAAIKFEKGRQIAYLAKKGSQSVQKVELKLGIRGEDRTEVLSGLAEGSELATKLVLPAASAASGKGSGAMKSPHGKKP
jgi:multidrug efflux pump subunit AcrA (membrane-fusion protein)